jgi:ATP-dependent DNA ligase
MSFETLEVKPGLPPMEAKLVDALPEGEGWRFEPKWDGFRCLVFRDGHAVELQSKAGKPLGRYFPRWLLRSPASMPSASCSTVNSSFPAATGWTSTLFKCGFTRPRAAFASCLARRRLSSCCSTAWSRRQGASLLGRPLQERRAALDAFLAAETEPSLLRSPFTRDRAAAQAWLGQTGAVLDGVIAKREDGIYEPGERAMLKIKCMRTADCVVGGFRYASKGGQVGSLLLGLFDEAGALHHVGFTSSIPGDKGELTKQLESLVEAPGFTGDAPGGPSRWANGRSEDWHPLRHELIAEVRYDHVTGRRFRHGTKFLRWRPDKAPGQCRMDQLLAESRPDEIVAALGRVQ